MNIDRLRPPKDCKDIDLWLSRVVWDAIRDAKEAGMSDASAHGLITIIARMLDPYGMRRVADVGHR